MSGRIPGNPPRPFQNTDTTQSLSSADQVRTDNHAQRSASTTLALSANHQPGVGPIYINGQLKLRTAVASNGFVSAFATPCTHTLSARDRIPPSMSTQMRVNSDLAAYAEEARQCINNVSDYQGDNSPEKLLQLKQRTLQYINGFSPPQQEQIARAIHYYQESEGDNYFMNVNAMGYSSLRQFLQATYQREIADGDLTRFIFGFNESYSLEPESMAEFNARKTRLEERLQHPTATLMHVLHRAPVISDLMVQKGIYCRDNFCDTTLNSNLALRRMLTGDALLFNGFFSTTSSTDMALMFARLGDVEDDMKIDKMGNPLCVVDLTRSSGSSETLRRVMLNQLRGHSRWHPSHLLFNCSTRGARGIHVDAVATCGLSDHSRARIDEKEILFAPGHHFQAHKFTFCRNGCIIDGTLSYSR